MYFTINTAFTNYLEMFPNFTDSLQTLLIRNRTTFKQILAITLNVSQFDKSLLNASMDLKDFMNQYNKRKEILICKKGMIPHLILTKISFLIITFWTSLYSFLV